MVLLERSKRETRLSVVLMGKLTYTLIYFFSHDLVSGGVLRPAIFRYF